MRVLVTKTPDKDQVSLNLDLENLRVLARALGYQLVPGNEPMKNPRYRAVRKHFHDAWGDAKNSPDYNKDVWMNLEEAIYALAIGKDLENKPIELKPRKV